MENSVTPNHQTLLGPIKDTLAAPTEVTPANYQPGAGDDPVGDAYKNAGRCPPGSQQCMDLAGSPDFEAEMGAQVGLDALDAISPAPGDIDSLLLALSEGLTLPFDRTGITNPVPDYLDCKKGDRAACGFILLGMAPIGRIPRLGAMLGDLAGNLPRLGVIVEGAGNATRKINFRPNAADLNWGLTPQHLRKQHRGHRGHLPEGGWQWDVPVRNSNPRQRRRHLRPRHPAD